MATTGKLNANFYDSDGHRWKISVDFNYVSPTMNMTPQSDFSDIPLKWGNIANAFNARSTQCNVSDTFIDGDPASMDHLTNSCNAYRDSHLLFGEPFCPDTVENTWNMFRECWNITGEPQVGANVKNAHEMYYNCYNITGTGVIPYNVRNAHNMYYKAYNIEHIGLSTDSMLVNGYYAYSDCNNIVDAAVVGNNQIDARFMYQACNRINGICNIYATELNNASYMFWLSLGSVNTFNDLRPWSGIYEWHADNCRWINVWHSDNSRRPTEHWNATHIIINQTYPNGVNTMSFNNLKTVNEPVCGWTFSDIKDHEVLGMKTGGNIWFHYNNQWNYHNESKIIDDIEYVDIYGKKVSDYGSTPGAWDDFKLYTPSPCKNVNFVTNGEHMRFIESDRQWYNGDTTYALIANVHYVNGETKEYPYVRAYLSNWIHQYGRGLYANTEVLVSLPHEIVSDIDHKYPPKIYFNGDFFNMFQGATAMTKFPNFEVSDGYSVDYSDCFSKINNFYRFFGACYNLKEEPKNWSGWSSLDNGLVNCYEMFVNCNSLIGHPYFHENMSRNIRGMYAESNGSMNGLCDIPNFRDESGLYNAIYLFWSSGTRVTTHNDFGTGMYNCYFDRFGAVNDWFCFSANCGPSIYRNALHLFINKYYPGTEELTATYNSFLKNTQNGKTPGLASALAVNLRPPVGSDNFIRFGTSQFFVHFDEDRDLDRQILDVEELEFTTTGNMSDSRAHFQTWATADHTGIFNPIEATGMMWEWAETYGTKAIAHLKDGTDYEFKTYYGGAYAGRALGMYGYTANNYWAPCLPWWIKCDLEGHKKEPDRYVFSGDWNYMFNASPSKYFPHHEKQGHNFFYKVTNSARMFAQTQMGTSMSEMEDMSDFNFCMSTNAMGMFYASRNFCADLSKADFSNVLHGNYMFEGVDLADFKPCSVPKSINAYNFMARCYACTADMTDVKLGDQLVNAYGCFYDDRNIRGTVYVPNTVAAGANFSQFVRNCRNVDTVIFNSDSMTTTFDAFWFCGADESDCNLYLPNDYKSLVVSGMMGCYSGDLVQWSKHNKHIYDPYYKMPELQKTSRWWDHFKGSLSDATGTGVYSSSAFAYWTDRWVSLSVTWQDYPDKGYLFNSQYNIYYHYADPILAEIPLPDEVKSLFASGDVTSFVTT